MAGPLAGSCRASATRAAGGSIQRRAEGQLLACRSAARGAACFRYRPPRHRRPDPPDLQSGARRHRVSGPHPCAGPHLHGRHQPVHAARAPRHRLRQGRRRLGAEIPRAVRQVMSASVADKTGTAPGHRSAGLSHENRILVITVAVVLALVFTFVFSNVAANHQPKPHGLPVGIAGSSRAVGALTQQLDRSAPAAYAVNAYSSAARAAPAVSQRKVYGAFEPGPRPSLLVARAASRPAAQVLQATFQAVAHAQGHRLAVRDLAPLPPSDSSGSTAYSALLSLLIAGLLGSSLIYQATQYRPLRVRLAALLVLGIGAGFLAALGTNVLVGAFPASFAAVWGVATLFVLAIALPVAAFQVLLGIPGTAVGLLVFVVIGNPASGGSSAPQLLPGFWRTISQALPPGAANTAMRDVVYFDGHGATNALLVLVTYAVLGAAGTIAAYRLRGRHRPAPAA